jgi:hypothetical protein
MDNISKVLRGSEGGESELDRRLGLSPSDEVINAEIMLSAETDDSKLSN